MLWNPINGDAVTQPIGSIVRVGVVPNSVVLAKADTVANATNVVGTRMANVLTTDPGEIQPLHPGMTVRMVAEPAINDVVYLSDTDDGCGVNVSPVVKTIIGICYEKYQDGGVWFANLIPQVSPEPTPPVS
jgi:hypothetical protein